MLNLPRVQYILLCGLIIISKLVNLALRMHNDSSLIITRVTIILLVLRVINGFQGISTLLLLLLGYLVIVKLALS